MPLYLNYFQRKNEIQKQKSQYEYSIIADVASKLKNLTRVEVLDSSYFKQKTILYEDLPGKVLLLANKKYDTSLMEIQMLEPLYANVFKARSLMDTLNEKIRISNFYSGVQAPLSQEEIAAAQYYNNLLASIEQSLYSQPGYTMLKDRSTGYIDTIMRDVTVLVRRKDQGERHLIDSVTTEFISKQREIDFLKKDIAKEWEHRINAFIDALISSNTYTNYNQDYKDSNR